ncbi:dihydroorotate dehydrogenase [Buchnera aphidicola (Artemisaphis artemisicola)]|uniref:Dihydroorotate dehydrogenase n=1 Tax=Buchnera aphidicola (Artemisaphis artemisicola) TaxID=1241836 RepID=A0A4D6XMX3_9GAMM|nr:dihydroorotate dehydrogenase [Buchnera aphidicola (Artemisaphis artemisicola)]
MFYYLIRKFLFSIEPEKAHFLALQYLKIKKNKLFNFFFLNL